MTTHRSSYPLDLGSTGYAYVERPNRAIVELLEKHVLRGTPNARILDVGCGCGANAREIGRIANGATVLGIEPNAQAAELARAACHEVFQGTLDAWLTTAQSDRFDAVVLSDVLEHIADPIAFLQSLRSAPQLQSATFIVSVPNYGVWYNRLRTLVGRFEYAWSGLYDRTHLRFYTRRSIRELLSYVGLQVRDDACTPSLVQSTAPILRRFFDDDVAKGNHLALNESRGYQLYVKAVEPVETGVCQLWPELLGFQIVSVAVPTPTAH
jgi:SAM-dependent methyltransferase